MLLAAGQVRALEQYLEKQNMCILSEGEIKSFYRQLILDSGFDADESIIEKAKSLVEERKEGFGIFTGILEYTHWNLLVGSQAYDLYYAISSHKDIYKCTAVELESGRMVLLDFLEVKSLSEMERIVRFSAYKMGRMDITGSNPVVENDAVKAVRPPKDEWGMAIYR